MVFCSGKLEFAQRIALPSQRKLSPKPGLLKFNFDKWVKFNPSWSKLIIKVESF